MGINIINKHATEQKGWGRGGDRVLKHGEKRDKRQKEEKENK